MSGSVCDHVHSLAHVKRGKLYVRERMDFDQQISLMNEKWELEVIVRRLLATRSWLQNKAYWGLVIDRIVRHCEGQHTPNEVHELLKAKFLPKTLALADGNGEVVFEYVIGGSTRKLNTVQFSEYENEIRLWALEKLGLEIPEPDARWREGAL